MLRVFSKRLFQVSGAMLLFFLGACTVLDCKDEAESLPPYKEQAFLDRRLYVYQTKTLFALLKPQMKNDAPDKLAPVVAYAKQNPELKIRVSSYADNASNSLASEVQRDFAAEVVASYLWASGVENNLEYEGYKGGQHSVSANKVASIGAENRRIEIEFLDENRKK
jgi:outer membrane protein OmpA-like peptidoglycan-associated protein